jgi:arylsulfatase A-like enzyme
MDRVDRGVGEILETLRKRGLEKNTIVIFTNDNGGVGLSHSAPCFTESSPRGKVAFECQR